MGSGGCGQFITRCLCCSFLSGGGLLTICPCSSMRSFPRETVLHKLLQNGSLPWGAVLQEQAAPAWLPHGVTSPASKPALVWAPLSMGPQVLAGACFSVGSPQGHSLLQASPCSGVGSPQAADGDLLHRGPPWAAGAQPASPWSAPETAEASLLQCLEHLLPSFCTDLGACRAVSPTSSHFLPADVAQQFLLFLNYVIPELLPPSLMGSALASG